ncbi:MAG: DUF58 domain-containing protein [Clostridium sp.]|nr:DUF58 domain-containing protein [Clostridium sp.]MCM1398228.1 DUF58 domain-containing protein [Clostridium sp.]MCM1460358.1 DUF58 domain-containing protein [Bacteroides sp.]
MQIIIALTIAIIIYSLQNRLYRKTWDKGLKINADFDAAYMEVGERAALTLVVNNAKKLPLPVLHVKFSAPRYFIFDDTDNSSVTDLYYRNDAFSVMGGQKITRTLGFSAAKRGYYEISGINIIAKNFFMTQTYAKTLHTGTSIYVFPRKHKDVPFVNMANEILGDLEVRHRLIEDPYTFRGIREYGPRDGMNRINWNASAKTGKLMVNLYNQTSEQKLKLLLNLDTNIMIKSDYIRELCIEITSSLAYEMTGKGMSVMVASNGEDGNGVPMGKIEFGASQNHMITIDKYLAGIHGQGDASAFLKILDGEFEGDDGHTAYIIISAYCKADLLDRLDYMHKKGISVYMVVPYYDQYGLGVSRPYLYAREVVLNDT